VILRVSIIYHYATVIQGGRDIFDTKSTQRLGNDGFIWFIGIVEDIDDPLQLGRVRVRILGDHTQSTKSERIPTDGLPWAYLMNGPLSSSMQGIGDSPTGLYVKGAWVKGFYWDGIDKQQPVITNSFGGIPESIPFKPKKSDDTDEDGEDLGNDCGFQDPDTVFPMGHHIFEQDTNRLARNTPSDHAFEVPESLVPPQEVMIKEGLCPKKAVYGKKYYDKFDEAYVRRFAQGEHEKDSDDDSVIDNETQSTEELKVKDKEDSKCQFFLEKNNHPFTVFKWINKERFIPKCKVFADPMHREYWHEPDNPWDVKYPYNKVWEGYHEVGEESASNPGNNGFVSSSYGYDKSIENYDGSEKEGIYRKQVCGYGSWGLGEEWDSTPGKNRYHRFTPSGNYFEIDQEGNETRKIYGDSFEIDLKDRTILIKGDWNVTVEGDKNELIEGDYNLQVMGDLNTDVRSGIKTHCDGNMDVHVKDNQRVIVDGDQELRVAGSRELIVCKDDKVWSKTAERRADEIVRKGGKLIHDEGFVKFEVIAHDMEQRICNLSTDVSAWEERTGILNSNVNVLTENVNVHYENHALHNETATDYNGCIAHSFLNVIDYELIYQNIYLVEQGAFACVQEPDIVELPVVGSSNYPETDGITKCLDRYNKSIEAAKGACMTTLIDPRTLEDYERFDWEKYHASVESAKRSYENCVRQNEGSTCDVCSPVPGALVWECMGCHDPDCPAEEKEYEFWECDCECDGSKEEKFVDPWLDCEQEKP